MELETNGAKLTGTPEEMKVFLGLTKETTTKEVAFGDFNKPKRKYVKSGKWKNQILFEHGGRPSSLIEKPSAAMNKKYEIAADKVIRDGMTMTAAIIDVFKLNTRHPGKFYLMKLRYVLKKRNFDYKKAPQFGKVSNARKRLPRGTKNRIVTPQMLEDYKNGVTISQIIKVYKNRHADGMDYKVIQKAAKTKDGGTKDEDKVERAETESLQERYK